MKASARCSSLSMYVTFAVLLVAPAFANVPRVTLTANPPGPQKIGTPVTFTATVLNPPQGHTFDYQFSTTAPDGTHEILRDYNVPNSFTQATLQEGTYAISVVVRDTTHTPYFVYPPVQIRYVMQPWIPLFSSTGAVHPTASPLVALFSAPTCPAGQYMAVQFRLGSAGPVSATNALPCTPGLTENVYVAGMLQNSLYEMNWARLDASGNVLATGAQLPFNTGSIPSGVTLPNMTVLQAPPPESEAYPVIFHAPLAFPQPFVPFATDLYGNVIWYGPFPVSFTTHTEPNGDVMGIESPSWDLHQQVLFEMDLAGNVVQTTNGSILNEQLAALAIRNGQQPIAITSLHHEARRYAPNGDILVYGSRDVVSTQYQGGTQQNPVDIIGDVLLVLDPNMQLIWYWDSFAHEDLSRLATLDDTCLQGQSGCPPFNQQFQMANDWLHSNSAQFTADGNIVVSQRNQDLVLKINYNNGAGDGSILWRLGNQGDFTLVNPLQTTCSDPGVAQWFTHQHDAEFQFNDTTIDGLQVMTVFDDGNTRLAVCDPHANSRGMLLFMSEPDRQIYMEITPLNGYSGALGSAQVMLYDDGSYNTSYDNGFLGTLQSPFSQTVESDQAGNIVYAIQANGPWTYRTFRMRDLYSPPEL